MRIGPSSHTSPLQMAQKLAAVRRREAPTRIDDAERRQIRELAQRDQEVRAHEQAHRAAAGRFAVGGPSYDQVRGPDGRQYAVGGEVQIDVSPVPDDPEATLRKMQQVQAAALAPSEPSPQDRRVAAEATQRANRARAELARAKADDSPASFRSVDLFV